MFAPLRWLTRSFFVLRHTSFSIPFRLQMSAQSLISDRYAASLTGQGYDAAELETSIVTALLSLFVFDDVKALLSSET